MSAIITTCRECEREITLAPSSIGNGATCGGCGKQIPLRIDRTLQERNFVRNCVACGHDTLYTQKDFNRNLGVAIVVLGSLVCLYFFSRSQPIYAILALFVSAAVDLLIYSIVGEVTVCYSCHTIYRGFEKNPDHGPFDLKDLEKYGGREPRF